uniref:Uncharacterized protein n=1 Tax=viral metagenome TaxID=1070528 RepID=A0A6C0LMC8_9ZZZZ
MPINAASNYPNLAVVNTLSLNFVDSNGNRVDNLVQEFLSTLTQAAYDPMVVGLNEAVAEIKSIPGDESFRALLAIDDGTVAYDSSKGASNTYENFTKGLINENHNTRPEILVAILGNSGVGLSNRYSRSVGAFLKYQATRLGASTQTNLGTYRVSLSDSTVY